MQETSPGLGFERVTSELRAITSKSWRPGGQKALRKDTTAARSCMFASPDKCRKTDINSNCQFSHFGPLYSTERLFKTLKILKFKPERQ